MAAPPPALVYMAWPGSETFFCGGRLVSGPDWRNALLTSGLVLVPMALFCAFVAPVYVAEVPHGWLVAAAGAAWAAVTVALLLVTACTDPGVLPRRDGEARPQGVPQQRRVPVHGVDVVVNLNRTCGIYQPPRAHHCSINDDCIEKFDHHCPWVGNTVGLRNYRFFLAMIFSLALLIFFALVLSCVGAFHFHQAVLRDERRAETGDPNASGPSQASSLGHEHGGLGGVTLLIIILCILALPFVGGLSIFHLILVSRNQTTYENFKANAAERSAYDLGCLRNWYAVFCVPIPPSKVDFRAPKAKPDGAGAAGDEAATSPAVSLPNAAVMRDKAAGLHAGDGDGDGDGGDPDQFGVVVSDD